MPHQIQILERLLTEFTDKEGIRQIFVRGSISNGRFDRSSDTDLAIVVDDAVFGNYLRILDDLMMVTFGAVLPGWVDKIVPDFGGTGLVYLVRAQDGQVFQLDIYVAPASTANFANIRAGEIKRLFPYPDNSPIPSNCAPDALAQKLVLDEIVKFWQEKDTVESDFVAVCVHAVMILKRIQRATFWLNMSNSVGLLESIRQLLRRKYCSGLREYGWYKFDAIVVDQTSQELALELKDLATLLLPAASFSSVERSFSLAVRIMSTCFPEEYQALRLPSNFILETIQRYSLSLN
ncbi:hypothetical protein BH10CYA1_BH10CYA1_55770 [soil metagenome]